MLNVNRGTINAMAKPATARPTLQQQPSYGATHSYSELAYAGYAPNTQPSVAATTATSV
jgi:hypothetical protein